MLFEVYYILIWYRFIKHIYHMFELIIHIVTCIFVELIDNIDIPKIEFTCINLLYLFQSVYWCILWYSLHLHSNQYHKNMYTISFKIDHSCNNMQIFEISLKYQYSQDWVHMYNWPNINLVCIDVLFEIYDISIQYRAIDMSIPYL